MKTRMFFTILLVALCFISTAQVVSPGVMYPGSTDVITITGPYFGQTAPGPVPKRFASSFISKGDWGISFSPDGLECFLTRTIDGRNTILTAKDTGGAWTGLTVAGFSGTYSDMESVITPDGEMLYFGSLRPLAGCPPDILYQWYLEKTDSGWSGPDAMDPPLRGVLMMYPSVAANGNMYYSGWDSSGDQWIAFSRNVDGQYQEPVPLDDSINSTPWPAHPFIATDESYIIFDAVTDTANWARDLYICYRKPDSTWTRAINLGTKFNQATYSMFPFVSRDGKYFFFYRDMYIVWADAGFIEQMRPRYGDWLGETPPDTVPKIFAKNYISNSPNQVYSCTFSPTGDEFYYSNYTGNSNCIWKSERINNTWTTPALAPLLQSPWTIEPNFSPDGNTLIFVSTMADIPPGPPYHPRLRIWTMERSDSGWSDPHLLQGPFSDSLKMFPSLAENRNLYYTEIMNERGYIFTSEWSDENGYQTPVKLDSAVNRFANQAHPFIAPDENFLIFDAIEEGPPQWISHLYISYRNPDGTWKEAKKLPEIINATETEYCGFLSHDQKYLFFSRNDSTGKTYIWWVRVDHIFNPSGIGENNVDHMLPELQQNYPNPAGESTIIRITVRKPEKIVLKLFDLPGKEEMIIADQKANAGTFDFRIRTGDLKPGVYFYSLYTDHSLCTKKMVVVKH